MSDRDEAVQKLAEEVVTSCYPVRGREQLNLTGFTEQKVRAFLAEREADLQAQLHRALGELAGLRGAVTAAEDYFRARDEVPRPSTVEPRGAARMAKIKRCKAEVAAAERRFRCALTFAPLGERAGEVLSELETCRQNPGCDWTGFEPLLDKMDALRAELAKGGE